MKILLTIFLIVTLTGCASVKDFLKGSAKVATATVIFPECRSEFEVDVPQSVKDEVNVEFARLDKLVEDFTDLTKGELKLTFSEAVDNIVNSPATADSIKADFDNIAIVTHSYYASDESLSNPFLIACEDHLRSAYKVVRSNGKIEDFLREIAPYARVGSRVAIKAILAL